MLLTMLIVTGAAVSLTGLSVAATRKANRQELDGETTLVGFRDAASDTMILTPPPGIGNDWQLTSVDDLSEAEDLLDSLEAHGYTDRELVILGNSAFAVRWR